MRSTVYSGLTMFTAGPIRLEAPNYFNKQLCGIQGYELAAISVKEALGLC